MAGGRSLAAAFPIATRLAIGQRDYEIEIVRERDGGYARPRGISSVPFEIDGVGGDTIRFRQSGRQQSAKFLRRDDRLYSAA